MKKAEKNDVDFREMKLQYESAFLEQLTDVKKLVKEREVLHLYVRRLKAENAFLAATTNDDETIRLLTYAAQTPTTPEVGRFSFSRHGCRTLVSLGSPSLD